MKTIHRLTIETLEPRVAPGALAGIGASEGHLGVSASTRTAQTTQTIGGTAFEVGVTGGQIAAGAFGGPGAASAVGSLRGLGSAIGGSGGFGGGTPDNPNFVDVQCITDPCDPVFEPGAASTMRFDPGDYSPSSTTSVEGVTCKMGRVELQ